MIPLALLLERADAAILSHGASARETIAAALDEAIRRGEDADKIRELDHIVQLLEFRDRHSASRR